MDYGHRNKTRWPNHTLLTYTSPGDWPSEGERGVVGGDHRCTDVCVAEKFLDRVNVPPARFDRIPFDCMLYQDLLKATAPPAAAALRHPGLRVPERTPPATGDPGCRGRQVHA